MHMIEQQGDTGSARAAALAVDLRVLIGKLKRRLREQAHLGDLNWSQVSVLGRLERDGPATVTTLARAEGVRPQSMGANVSVLETAGLVTGTPDPNDGRQTILSLTAACREWIKADRAAREDWLFRAIRTNLAPEEQEELASAVELLKRLVDS
jgi:DNA-binding MarR family transcriptional regulator